MLKIDDIKPNCLIKGLHNRNSVNKVISTNKIGNDTLEVIYDHEDHILSRIIFTDNLDDLILVSEGDLWSFAGDGKKIKSALEAFRIKLAYYYDPFLAVNISLIDPLPHQITAVYQEMLSRQPLRYLLADDPGSGKTIMAGLLIKELIARGDLERCLIITPGNLVEQWQDELKEKFKVDFHIFSRNINIDDETNNYFENNDLIIARLDMLARDENLIAKISKAKEWDLIIVDEAHRMSASVFGNDVNKTKRYLLGQKLSAKCRNFLLMSATPHNGKNEDFQLFMSLLDEDRFEGSYRRGVHISDTSDLMRRLTKEELLKFDGTPLFPERIAYTVKYTLSEDENALYYKVTEYVRTEMNRVQRFVDTDNKKRVNVNFALQILQRRLASSPAAIYSSLKRRKEKLQNQLTEAKFLKKGKIIYSEYLFQNDILDNLEEYFEKDIEDIEDKISTNATLANSIEELEQEVETLKELEDLALQVLRSGKDTKWNELKQVFEENILQDKKGHAKIIIFTEAKDTLLYLVEKIRSLTGNIDEVDCIHGSVSREQRKSVIHRFMQDKNLKILVANDAAGEGVNLQRANLMVNYDLPWNPNKIEQRFGRIHRIGQVKKCYLWNLVASETREGEVYSKLLEKLENVRGSLNGQVFDVLGKLFDNVTLKDLILKHLNSQEIEKDREDLNKNFDKIFDVDYLNKIVKEKKLTNDLMLEKDVFDTKLEIEKAQARMLQPHNIQSFFIETFQNFGGKISEREKGRYEITFVPFRLIEKDREIGSKNPINKRYERICFDKQNINLEPIAEFICPGHPLLEALISIVIEQSFHLLEQGAIMVDENSLESELSVIFLIEHSLSDGKRTIRNGNNVISKKIQFIKLSKDGNISMAGEAPHLDLRPINLDEKQNLEEILSNKWIDDNTINKVNDFAIEVVAKNHLDEIKKIRETQIKKTEKEVSRRLTSEINRLYNEATLLREKENINNMSRTKSDNAIKRANNIENRLKKRINELNHEKKIIPSRPKVLGGLLVVPQGLLEINNKVNLGKGVDFENRKRIENIAMNAVMDNEKKLGFIPEDVSSQNMGYDILSFDKFKNKYRFLEVKGRAYEQKEITVSKNEIITGLNKNKDFAIVIVYVDKNENTDPIYCWNPFTVMPSEESVSTSYSIKKLINKSNMH